MEFFSKYLECMYDWNDALKSVLSPVRDESFEKGLPIFLCIAFFHSNIKSIWIWALVSILISNVLTHLYRTCIRHTVLMEHRLLHSFFTHVISYLMGWRQNKLKYTIINVSVRLNALVQ